ncbi:hypothetical protein OIV83_000701 [Microbotryomycetes sp. JL201]|nr:hypothetical protein OIV83_000701 [Microbotryomycetes sp. JL201]
MAYDSRLHPPLDNRSDWAESEEETTTFQHVQTKVSFVEKHTKLAPAFDQISRPLEHGRLAQEMSSIKGLKALITETRDRFTGVDDLNPSSSIQAPLRSRRTRHDEPESQERMVVLADSLSHNILIAYETIQQVKIEFPTLTKASLGSYSANRHEHRRIKTLRKKINSLFADFAKLLDRIEDRAADEREQVEKGRCVARLEAFIAETRPQLSVKAQKQLALEAQDQASNVPIVRLHPISLARRWALENIFSTIDKTLDRIDRLEREYACRQSSTSRNKPTSTKRRKRTRRGGLRLFDLTKSSDRPQTTGDSSDSGASLIEDGQLPYVIPSDDPNGDHQTQKEVLEHFKHKRRLVRKTIPWLVLYWVAILALYVYWGVSRALGNQDPLGSIRLNSFLGDGGWSDKHNQAAKGVGREVLGNNGVLSPDVASDAARLSNRLIPVVADPASALGLINNVTE